MTISTSDGNPRPSLARRFVPALVVALIVALTPATASHASDPPTTIGGNRPAEVKVPSDYDPNRSYPLVFTLGGTGTKGRHAAGAFGITDSIVDQHQVVLVMPDQDGLWWQDGISGRTGDSDVVYLTGLIEEAKSTFNIDDSRVAIWGWSNGGFMAHRMLCEASAPISAIVSLSGSSYPSAASCSPHDSPVSVLNVHSTADANVAYGGTSNYAGQIELTERVAGFVGCSTTIIEDGGTVDITDAVAGEETSIARYNSGCAPGTSVELWTMTGVPHVVLYNANHANLVLDWINDQQKAGSPVIRPIGVVVAEGDAGSQVAHARVVLDRPAVDPVTVEWTVIDTAHSAVAHIGSDVAAGGGVLTFAPGQTEATVPVTVFGDTEVEPPLLYGEWGLVHFANPSPNATVHPGFFGLAVVIIVDND